MFQVKPMRPEDFQFATQLANTMNWNMAPEDFEFNATIEPDGCLVALNGSERIGIATCISFDRIGWFGNLIVDEKYREKGVGSLLVKHAINYLQGKGVKTVGLYAYPNLKRFYGSLGFKADDDFSLLSVESLGTLSAETLPEVGKKRIAAIETFDCQFFGGNRAKLLESIILEKGNLSYCHFEDGEVAGYVAATVYEQMAWLGPLICKAGKFDVAASLIQAVLSKLTGLSVYAVMPKKETDIANLFFKAGFTEEFSVTRMFFGEFTAKNCIYLAESLERG
jgi:GNAT superfamily N-acetyltransferase